MLAPSRWSKHPIERVPSGNLSGRSFECNDRNFAFRLLLIFGIGRKYLRCPPERSFSLLAGKNAGCGIKFLATNLNRNLGMGQHVEIPVRMFWITSFRSHRK